MSKVQSTLQPSYPNYQSLTESVRVVSRFGPHVATKKSFDYAQTWVIQFIIALRLLKKKVKSQHTVSRAVDGPGQVHMLHKGMNKSDTIRIKSTSTIMSSPHPYPCQTVHIYIHLLGLYMCELQQVHLTTTYRVDKRSSSSMF